MNKHMHRREALKTTVAAGAGFWLGTASRTRAAEGSANEKVNLAVIGIGGQGGSNLRQVAGLQQNIVALCDVDDARAGKAYEQHPQAKKFYDFRQMFDQMHKQIDAVVVSTPDHMHFHPSMIALDLGKHLYCEKPMAHSVWEARQMTELAARKQVATQLGVQRHTIPNMHRVVELIQGGAIGEVSEVHSWIGGSRGMPKIPQDRPPTPSHLKWDLWLGAAPERPYHPTYCPYGWRFWWDFGTGEMGNWGCHILDIPYWALGLTYPTRVDASGPEVDPQTTPKQMTTSFKFPAAAGRSAVTLHWYHAANGPPILKELGLPAGGNNNLFIGSKGMLLCGFGSRKLYPEKDFADYRAPQQTIPNSPGFHREWIQACQGGTPATCHFGYSGPMAETVLLGNVAYRAGGGFDWDAKTLTAKGNDQAAQYLRSVFRQGWESPV